MAHEATALKHHFDDLEQQHEADRLGMWTFLITEILLFGGLFLAYAVCRSLYPEAWAEGATHQHVWWGTANTAILLVSSLTVALAVHAAEDERWRPAALLLAVTAVLGLAFLGIKFYEYYLHWQHGYVPGIEFHPEHPHLALYFVFYYAMTGLHALHMIIGVSLVSVMAVLAGQRRLAHFMPVEVTGLYWHLIDIIWVFLFPLLYLIG